MLAPLVLVFDSGLGGLGVFRAVRDACPDAALVYAADDAGFPYGPRGEANLVARVMSVMDGLVAAYRPAIVVVACNTASTAVLPPLRARWPAITFVGTVPAIKPAVARSTSRMVSVLATPGTVAREYTHDLVRAFAGDCAVTLVGAPRLAGMVEAEFAGHPVDDATLRAEIAPCFVWADEPGGRRTDTVVLACTHFPLIVDRLRAMAPWPVAFIDPAPAIARRVMDVAAGLGIGRGLELSAHGRAVFTSGAPPRPEVAAMLAACGLAMPGGA